MKKFFRMFALLAMAAMTTVMVTSCSDDDDDYMSTERAIVTLKSTPSTGQFYMQLNDSVTLIPTNIKTSPSKDKEMRAYVWYNLNDSIAEHYSHSVSVLRIDTIITKKMSPKVDSLGKAYGNDPVEIVKSWETICEDGYLTLRFRTYFGNQKTHSLYLVRTGDNTVQLCHNANGDIKSYIGDGIIAFRLNDMPDTDGKYKDLKLVYNSFEGEKSITFKYKSRE